MHINYNIFSELWIKIVSALFLGILTGLFLSPQGLGWFPENHAMQIACWLAFPGHIFLALIKMIILPLIISSIILGVNSSGDITFLKKLGFKIVPYFLFTTAFAVLIGIAVTSVIKPGLYINQEISNHQNTVINNENATTQSFTYLPEKISKLIPENPVEAAVSLSMLEIVVFSILIAIALLSIGKIKAQPIIDLSTSLQDMSMKIVSWSMTLAPYAVFGLIAQITIKIGFKAIIGLSLYVITVILGLFLLLLFYLFLIYILGKKNPIEFMKNIKEVQLLAFTTSSSAAVMPLSMKVAEEKLSIQPRISKFVIPIGATVNMDGTALYQLSASLFLTQMFGIDLSISELIILATTTIGASIGSPSTPGVGIVILSSILYGLGVPESGIALLIGVDRILDMSRTSINVTGDLTACVIMNKYFDQNKVENHE